MSYAAWWRPNGETRLEDSDLLGTGIEGEEGPGAAKRAEANDVRVPVEQHECILKVASRSNPEVGLGQVHVRFLRHSPLLRGATIGGEKGTFALPSAGIYSITIERKGFIRLFVKALRCEVGGDPQTILLERGTRLELSLFSSQSAPTADVDVLLLPGDVPAKPSWRRSALYGVDGLLDHVERALVRSRTRADAPVKTTADIVNSVVERLVEQTLISREWLPYLASNFFRKRSDEGGLVVWDGIPGSFRWGLLSNQLTAEMNPRFEKRESRVVPGGGVIPARRVPPNLSGIVPEQPGKTVRLRAKVNVGNWIKARIEIPEGYRPMRRIMLLSRFKEEKGGQRLVHFVNEHESGIDVDGVCVFHGVRPGHKVLKAWAENKSVPAYRFYSHAFEYKGGYLDLGRIKADMGKGDAMLGVRVSGDPGKVSEILAFDMSMLMVTPREAGGGHYKLEVQMTPGKLLKLEGQLGRRVYPELKPILRHGAGRIDLEKTLFAVESLKALHWIDARILSPVQSKVRVSYAPGLSNISGSIIVTVLTQNGGRDSGSAVRDTGWAEFKIEAAVPGFVAYAVQYDSRGEARAAGFSGFQEGLARVQLQEGATLDVIVAPGGRRGRVQPVVRLVPEFVAMKRRLESPWVKSAQLGKCSFEHIPTPGNYWIFVNDKKRKRIEFTRSTRVDLR